MLVGDQLVGFLFVNNLSRDAADLSWWAVALWSWQTCLHVTHKPHTGVKAAVRCCCRCLLVVAELYGSWHLPEFTDLLADDGHQQALQVASVKKSW
jgi:hypothetical protein